MATIVTQLLRLHKLVFDELSDPRSRGLFLLESPSTMVLILIGYVYLVTNLGPRFMEKRVPFNLRKVLIVYNTVQVTVNLILFFEAFRLGWGGTYNWLCEPIDRTITPMNLYICRLCHGYFLIKLTDLLDTVFMVLRKKNDHISFLHVYHHAGMCLLAWGAAKYLPGGHDTFLGFINTFVHAAMYGYYLVSVISPNAVSIAWKKFLTQLQMVQFLMVAIHSLLLVFQPNCIYPKFTVFIIVPQNLFMFLLFWDFYSKTYRKKRKEKLSDERNNSEGRSRMHME